MGSYISENWSVTNTSSKQYRVIKELGHLGTVGYIFDDGGTVFIQMSEKDGGAKAEMTHEVHSGEVFEFTKSQGWKIGEVLITTNSATALSGRIFIK